MNIVTRKLIAKELYVNRWLIVGGALAGVASLLIAALRQDRLQHRRAHLAHHHHRLRRDAGACSAS